MKSKLKSIKNLKFGSTLMISFVFFALVFLLSTIRYASVRDRVISSGPFFSKFLMNEPLVKISQEFKSMLSTTPEVVLYIEAIVLIILLALVLYTIFKVGKVALALLVFSPILIFLGLVLFGLLVEWQLYSSPLSIYSNLYNWHIVFSLALIFAFLMLKMKFSEDKEEARKIWLAKGFLLFLFILILFPIIKYSLKYNLEYYEAENKIHMHMYLMGHLPLFSKEWEGGEINEIIFEECGRKKRSGGRRSGSSGAYIGGWLTHSNLYFVLNSGEKLQIAFAEENIERKLSPKEGWKYEWIHEELYEKAKTISQALNKPLQEEVCEPLKKRDFYND